MDTLQSIGVFVGIPAGLFVIIALLVVAPSWGRDPRYRPGMDWTADPAWLGGPDADPADDGRRLLPAADRDPNVDSTGGASATW